MEYLVDAFKNVPISPKHNEATHSAPTEPTLLRVTDISTQHRCMNRGQPHMQGSMLGTISYNTVLFLNVLRVIIILSL